MELLLIAFLKAFSIFTTAFFIIGIIVYRKEDSFTIKLDDKTALYLALYAASIYSWLI